LYEEELYEEELFREELSGKNCRARIVWGRIHRKELKIYALFQEIHVKCLALEQEKEKKSKNQLSILPDIYSHKLEEGLI
jgi:hypothetical protein